MREFSEQAARQVADMPSASSDTDPVGRQFVESRPYRIGDRGSEGFNHLVRIGFERKPIEDAGSAKRVGSWRDGKQ